VEEPLRNGDETYWRQCWPRENEAKNDLFRQYTGVEEEQWRWFGNGQAMLTRLYNYSV